MLEFICSICDKELTQAAMINGTIMCRNCLKKVAKEAKDSESGLIQNMANEIIKENTMQDVYD